MSTGIIYCAHCIVTGKKYIGQTIQKFNVRIKHHRNIYKSQNTKFYNAIKKYGWDKFIWGIVDEYDYSSLNNKEIYWIEHFKTFTEGYNMTLGGCASNSPSIWRSYALLNPDGNIISGSNISELSRTYNLDPSSVSAVLSGKLLSHKGWKLPETNFTGGKYISQFLSKKFLFLSPDGTLYKGKNITKFCKKMKLSQSAMCAVHRGKHKQHKGWICPNIDEIDMNSYNIVEV